MSLILSYPRIEPVLLDAVRSTPMLAQLANASVGTEFRKTSAPYTQVVVSVEYGSQITPITRMATIRVDITVERQPAVFDWQTAQHLFDSIEQQLLALDGVDRIVHIEHTSGPMRIADNERVSAYGLLTVHISGLSKEE